MKKREIRLILSKFGLYNSARKLLGKFSSISYSRQYKKMVENGYKLPIPEQFIYEPTARCNLNCKMCYLKKVDMTKLNELDMDDVKKMLRNMPSMKHVSLIGGEIFLREDFYDMMGLFKDKGINMQLNTNATMINKERMEKNENIVGVSTSIDGPKNFHDMIRGVPGAFEKSTRAISLLKDKFSVSIVCVIMNANIDKLKEMLTLAKKLGLGSITFEYERKYTEKNVKKSAEIISSDRSDFPLMISRTFRNEYTFEKLQRKIKEIEEFKKKIGIQVYYLPRFFRKEMKNCYNRNLRKNGRYFCRLLFKPRINPQGNVIHCYVVRKKLGNILEKPFEEIWNSEEYVRFRKSLVENNLLPICETCLYMQKI